MVAILHLLLARRRQEMAITPDHGLLGMYPGIQFTGIGGPGEIDYVEIRSGSLVIGECKMGGWDGSLDQLVKLAEIANRLGSETLLLASASASVPPEIQQAVEK
jgi:hypothetical protein